MRSYGTIIAGVMSALVIAGCGGGQRQDASEPNGKFPVDVSTASFPTAGIRTSPRFRQIPKAWRAAMRPAR